MSEKIKVEKAKIKLVSRSNQEFIIEINSTQYNKKFTLEELYKFYQKEYGTNS